MTVFQGQKLRAARAAANLTQQELADLAGIQRETVTHAELGDHQPTTKTLVSLARALDVPVESLIEEVAL